jgi:hypothetical protein
MLPNWAFPGQMTGFPDKQLTGPSHCMVICRRRDPAGSSKKGTGDSEHSQVVQIFYKVSRCWETGLTRMEWPFGDMEEQGFRVYWDIDVCAKLRCQERKPVGLFSRRPHTRWHFPW